MRGEDTLKKKLNLKKLGQVGKTGEFPQFGSVTSDNIGIYDFKKGVGQRYRGGETPLKKVREVAR